jgi:hypothetical protein
LEGAFQRTAPAAFGRERESSAGTANATGTPDALAKPVCFRRRMEAFALLLCAFQETRPYGQRGEPRGRPVKLT